MGRGREAISHYGVQSPSFPYPGGEPVVGRDKVERWVQAVGDPPLGQIAYKFVRGPCPYVMWTAAGLTWAQALAYAEQLSTSDATRITVPSHCGVLSVTLEGQLWIADPPLGDHNPPPGWDENETSGFFEVIAKGRGEFSGDGGQHAFFRRAPVGAVDPNAGCE